MPDYKSPQLVLADMVGKPYRWRPDGRPRRINGFSINGNQILISTTDDPISTSFPKFLEVLGDFIPDPEAGPHLSSGENGLSVVSPPEERLPQPTAPITHQLLPEEMNKSFTFLNEKLRKAMELAQEGGAGLEKAKTMASVGQTFLNAMNTELKARQQLNAKK